MAEAASPVSARAPGRSDRPGLISALLQRNEVLRGYTLILPSFLIMVAGILIVLSGRDKERAKDGA